VLIVCGVGQVVQSVVVQMISMRMISAQKNRVHEVSNMEVNFLISVNELLVAV
jgi:hypothetical protein